jgi:hypothetical protein
MRLRQQTVHFGAAVGQPVDLVFPGNADDVLAARHGRVDFGVQNFLFQSVRLDQSLAAGIDNFAAADEIEAPFRSDAIDGNVKDGIFDGPRVDHAGGRAFGAGGPVRGEHDEIGPQNC